MESGYELFDHTADLGIRVRAPALEALLEPAAEGLYAAIGEVVGGAAGPELTLDLDGDGADVLLRDFLAELLHVFETRHHRLAGLEVLAFDERRLAVRARLAAVDIAGSRLAREVKAITYHDLAIRPVEGGFEATIIVDI